MFCVVGEPAGIGLDGIVCAAGVVATGSSGLTAVLLPFIGMPPPDMVENPVVVGSAPLTAAVDGVTVADVPAVVVVGVVVVVLVRVIAEFGVVA